jgi:hypothetical protein
MPTPLAQKLQFKPGQKILVLNAPAGYAEQLTKALKDNPLTTRASGKGEGVVLFVSNLAELKTHRAKAFKAVPAAGLVWIAYPKGTGKIKTDLNRDILWQTLEPLGWAGVRLIALDETWSVMRFRRVEK